MTAREREWRSSDGKISVLFEEQTSPSTETGLLWNAATHFAELLCNAPGFVCGLRVIELGAGCGLLSAVMASLGATVTATDAPALLERLKRTAVSGTATQHFAVAELEWGFRSLPEWAAPGHFDVVVGSDITYACGTHATCSLLELLWVFRCNGLLAHTVRSTELAAKLWQVIRESWRGYAWVVDGYDALEACHDTATEGEAIDRVITFGFSAAATIEDGPYAESYKTFIAASKPLVRQTVPRHKPPPDFIGPVEHEQDTTNY